MHRIALVVVGICLLAADGSAAAAAQQLRFDDVVRNLRNPDPAIRMNAIHLLRDAKYPEAVPPIAPLVMDPVDEIQIEAIAAELSFFLEQDVRSKKMVAFVVEKRSSALARAAFDLGPHAVWPREVPPELVAGLLTAVDDENKKVRAEAIYAIGVIARPPLAPEHVERLQKALDHYDPAIRTAAAEVIGRLKVTGTGEALLKAVNDSQAEVRYAAMRALGAVKDDHALQALTEQLAFYRKGEGAWSALDAMARIGAKSSIPVFRERLADKDAYIRRAAAEGIGRAGDTESLDALGRLANTDESPMVRMAAVFAETKLGRANASRIVDMMSSPKVLTQGEDYLVELGPAITSTIVPRLQEPEADVRESMADVLGMIGDASVLPAVEAVTKDREVSVAAAARRAVARIKAR
jgi:HEAT repeat protein